MFAAMRSCLPVVLLAGALALPAGAADRPNILWLIAEDFSPDLGCYGTKEVSTPNLDRLAGQGVRYTRFFTTAPVCSASRSAFMTGMYQTTIGAHNHRSHRDDGYRLPPGVRVLTDWMRDAGYFTANIRELPESLGFRGTGKTDWNFTYEGRPFDSDRWDDLKVHQPFYAQVNFQETHRTFHAPPHADPAKVEIPPYYPDHAVTREDWAKYLDAATELDRKIGLILKQLEADGLADSTIVVFFGDHGQAHVRAKQFCYDSGLRVPLIIRWPAKFPAPEHYAPGKVDDRLLMSIDLAPTMLSIAGAPQPEKMQGAPFLGPRSGPPRKYVFGARDRCDETVFRFRTVRSERYRYIRNFTPDRPFLQPNEYKERQYPVWNLLKELDAQGKLTPLQKFLTAPTMPPEELYDVVADPHETQNLVDSPAHQAVLGELRRVLNQWIEESNDQGRVLEPPEVAAAEGRTKPLPPEGQKKGKKQKAARAAARGAAYRVVPNLPQVPAALTLGAVSAAATDSRGNLLVFHRGEPPILIFDAAGKVQRSFGDGLFTSAHGLRVDAEDNVWVTDNANHTVLKFSRDGAILLRLGEENVPGDDASHFNKPADIAFAANGDFYIADGYGNSRVVKFDKAGKFLKAWGQKGIGPGEFHLPHAVQVDAEGRVFVADRENNRIQVFDADGRFLRQFGGFAPFGLFITPDQSLFVADGRANQVLKMTLDGQVLATFGGTGAEPGQLQLPHGITVARDGAVYVTEITGKRWQKFVPVP